VRQAIPDLVKVANLEDALRNLSGGSGGRNYMLLVTSSRDKAHLAKLADIASRYHDRIFFILIGDELSASEYKSLVRGGGADWVSARADPREILEIIANQQARTSLEAGSGGPPGSKPVAVAFVPSGGGVGNATLVIEASVQLKTSKPTRDRRICIVDLDFQSSHVCDYLDIEPRLQIQEISNNPERLDDQLFEIFISRHASGVHVFAAPRTKTDFHDLNVAALDLLFNMISARYDLILIDLPPTWFGWTAQIISASDGVVVTGVNTIPGLRQTAETLAAVRSHTRASSQIAVAINRCRRRMLGGIARRHHVESVLGRENVFYIAEASMALESVNTGTPMALSKANRAVNRDIAALAAFCTNLKSTRSGA
jgi:pilus assembly protein CpaE